MNTAFGHFQNGVTFVEKIRARSLKTREPVVIVPGLGVSTKFWVETPDGREGWATRLSRRGHDVYLLSAPTTFPSKDGLGVGLNLNLLSAEVYERLFTSPASFPKQWRKSERHNQWPGGGLRGDPVFDNFFANQIPFSVDAVAVEEAFRSHVSKLFEKLEAAIVITHSRGACLGWILLDECGAKVSRLIAIEPHGPPGSDFFSKMSHMDYGITYSKISYSPSEGPIGPDDWAASDVANILNYVGVSRKLTNMMQSQIFVVTSECSYHACFDHATVSFLRKMGLNVEHIELNRDGLMGNGHMMMLELNSNDVLDLIVHKAGL